jgi:type I restriction enzyme S subunit
LCDQLEAQQQERETRHAALAPASLARFAEAPTPANLEFLFHHAYDISPAELRKSILTLAVQGKLVPQNPNEEPASESIAPVVSLGRTATAKYSVAVSDGEAPYQVPVSWSWVRLGSVSELINGDRSKNYPNRNEYVPEGVPWINTGHIEPDGTLSVARMNYIKRKKFDSLRSGKVQRGDLVYCLRGATFGKTAIITQFTEGAVASSLVIIRLSASVLPQFGYNFLISPIGHKQIFQFDNGSAQPNLSARSVKKFWMPLPSFAEQRRIVAKVDELMTLVDKLETQLAAARTAATDLLAAAVAELTNGKENCAAADVSSVAHHRRDRTATFAEYLQPE